MLLHTYIIIYHVSHIFINIKLINTYMYVRVCVYLRIDHVKSISYTDNFPRLYDLLKSQSHLLGLILRTLFPCSSGFYWNTLY